MPAKKPSRRPPPEAPSHFHAFLDSAGVSRKTIRVRNGATVFAQGAPATAVYYLDSGAVKLSVVSSAGKEAVVAVLGPADFFGEGCLAGQPRYMATARAITGTTVLRIAKGEMARALRQEAAFSDRFIEHVLVRNIRIEEALVDQLFNSAEKRLARTLILLARYINEDLAAQKRTLPAMSQETLAEIVGTTRSRVNFFLNKFRTLGMIDYNGAITVNRALLSVVLHD